MEEKNKTDMNYRRTLNRWTLLLLSSLISLGLSSCGSSDKDKNSTPAAVPIAPTSPIAEPEFYLVIGSGDFNHAGVTAYNSSDGSFKRQITDYRDFGSAPNGLAAGGDALIASVNGSDALLNTSSDGSYNVFYGSSSLNGNVYDIERNSTTGYYYVVESNGIEVFNSTGQRQASAYIPSTLGSCVLSSPRNMHIDEEGYLYVASYSNNRILKYNVSSHIATCEASYSLGSLRPYGVTKHSSGLIYFTSYSDNSVYTYNEDDATLTQIFQPGLSILRSPTAILEVEEGNLLVSSSYTDSIEKIDASGTRIGIDPFIRDLYSLNILDMEWVQLED